MIRVRGFIFDYGGTLDTGGCHWGGMLWHAYREVGVPVSEQQFREAYVFVERTLGRQPIIQPEFTFRQTLETKLMLQLDYLSRDASSCNQPVPRCASSEFLSPLMSYLMETVHRHIAHSKEVLKQLVQPKVLVSNFYGNMSVVLREFGFDEMFQHVVESAVVGVRKPDSRIFMLGVEALDLPPGEVAVVGDSIEKDIIPAKKAGCLTVWLRGEQWTNEPADTSAADIIIDDLQELISTSKYN